MSNNAEALAAEYALGNQLIASERAENVALQATHLASSQRDITDTYQQALRRMPSHETSRAVVLGSGTCADIPLEGIATDFDAVTVIDADTAQTEQFLSTLPARALGKISLVQADVSGMAAGIAAAYGRAAQAPDFGSFLQAVTRELNALPVPPSPLFGGEYGFACSQLLMTQLATIPLNGLMRQAVSRYKPSAQTLGSRDLRAAILEVSAVQQHRHLTQLHDMVKPGGLVHFADTFQFVDSAGNGLPMVSPIIEAAIPTLFTPLRQPHKWRYQATPDRGYSVVSMALTPRTAA